MRNIHSADAPLGGAGGTRERILQAAGELFARHGYAHVSTRMVATAAGVTKPAVYYHFRDKESLFEECLADFNDQLARTMRAAAQREGTAAHRVLAMAEALLAGSPFHPVRVHEELAEHASGALRRRLRDTFHAIVVAPLVEAFEAMQRAGELRRDVAPTAAAAMLIGVCMAFLRPGPEGGEEGWAPLPLDPGLDVGPQAAAAMVSDLVLRGLASES